MLGDSMTISVRFRVLASALALVAGIAGSTQAQADNTKLYMTGSGDPWGMNGGDQAMDIAFGAGNWDKVNGFDVSKLTAGYSFIYLDGGDGTSTEFNNFMTANLAAVESYVTGGGHIMLNAARWDQPDLNLGFGTTLNSGYAGFAALTADGLAAGLDADGAGNGWSGDSFSHDTVGGVTTCYVVGDSGCAFGSKGNLFVGGQTDPGFQSNGAYQLRANELKLAANGEGAVPEPASWALMLIGFGTVGGAMRARRRAMVSFG